MMPAKFLRQFGVCIVLVSFYGCASVQSQIKSIEPKAYVKVADRVDQNLYGNVGYIFGKPPQEIYEKDRKKTRNIYVVEVTKQPLAGEGISETESTLLIDAPSQAISPQESESMSGVNPMDSSFNDAGGMEPASPAPAVVAPEVMFDPQAHLNVTQNDDMHQTQGAAISMEESTYLGVQLPTEYTINKNDTLQTIAKKFYNSYSKWPRIYDANKDKIADPNRIKPGLTITIPTLE